MYIVQRCLDLDPLSPFRLRHTLGCLARLLNCVHYEDCINVQFCMGHWVAPFESDVSRDAETALPIKELAVIGVYTVVMR